VTAPPSDAPEAVPEDVITGFWLWVTALPLMVVAYVIANLTAESPMPAWLTYTTTAVFAVNTAAVTGAFLYLMRKGYRWARTALTGGGAASAVFVCSDLLRSDAAALPAIAFAVTAIGGSVAIAGGIVLLHRSQAQAYFGPPRLG
jgi:hypothetical protein